MFLYLTARQNIDGLQNEKELSSSQIYYLRHFLLFPSAGGGGGNFCPGSLLLSALYSTHFVSYCEDDS
jgi:hypothetical protein